MITPTLDLERSLAAQGYDLIAGFDEVGRGALAGPVMVGCAAIWARDLEPLDGDDAVELSGRTYLGVPDGVAEIKGMLIIGIRYFCVHLSYSVLSRQL